MVEYIQGKPRIVSSEEKQFYLDNGYLCSWNGLNFNNKQVANGVYFCKIDINNKEFWEKLIVTDYK